MIMKLSKLIQQLQTVYGIEGDLEVGIDVGANNWIATPTITVIDIPENAYIGGISSDARKAVIL